MGISVQIGVRVRPPLLSNRTTEDVIVCAIPHKKEVILGNQNKFTADYVFSADYNQGFVYDCCISQRVNYLLEGYDISVIAYGKCSSGKTYSMFGPSLNGGPNESHHGMIPRATRHIFNTLMRHQQHMGVQYKVLVSFFEVANNEVRDLLSSSQTSKEFTLTTTEKGSTAIAGLANIPCQNVNEVFSCLRIGMFYRQNGLTNHPIATSQSHCFVVFTIHQQLVMGGRIERKVSKGTFADLASTEVVPYTGPDGQILHQNITNVGLRTLLSIITSLYSDRWVMAQHHPLLATLLKDAFTVSSHTLILCCVSPCSTDYVDTLNYLRFVEQVRTVYGFHQPMESACEINTITSSQELVFENSDTISTKADSFGLEFAATQWMKLVSNAEDLFQKLVQTSLPKEAREQIDQWLCFKQECEECLANDSTSNLQGKMIRSLGRIDEVTESEEKSSSDKSGSGSESDMNSLGEDVEGEEEEDDEEELDDDDDELGEMPSCTHASHIKVSRREDFSEKLEVLMISFRSSTDVEIDKCIEHLEDASSLESGTQPTKLYSRISNNGRRRSILPGDDINLQVNERKKEADSSLNLKEDFEISSPLIETSLKPQNEKLYKSKEEISFPFEAEKCSEKNCAQKLLETQKDTKLLPNASDSKQNQIGMVILDLEGANKRIDELQQMIRIKEQFIEEMIENSGARSTAKARLQRKLTQLEEEYYKALENLSKAEKAFKLGDCSLKGQVDKYKSLALKYEKRLRDLELIKQLAGDSGKKVVELESSLHNSKRKLQKLVKQLKKEEEHKLNLERELLQDQKRMKELEENQKLQSNKNEDSEELRLKWLAEEEERLMCMRESSQRLQEQLNEQQIMLEKRESFLKEKICQEKNVNKSILHVSARISHLEQVMKEKSTTLEQAENLEAKEALRHEIRNLRKTRDCLVEQRRNLDAKLNKDKVFSVSDERKFLECDEAIEAIDATIEYKNELMCGHKGIENSDVHREQGEKMLMERLMKLSEPEMRSLLYKYFQKVIDLRESGRKMEQQITEQDQQIETQAWKIQALSNALQQANIESERRLVMVHREHQEKLHLMFRHYAGETSGGSSSVEREGDKLYSQNKALKHRVLELEAMLYASSSDNSSVQPKNVSTPNTLHHSIPSQNLKKLQGAPISHTTKVTRQKNKLIIQQQKAKKHSK